MDEQPDRSVNSLRMASIRKKDTKPERAVRRMVHAMGYRFRLHRTDLPGTPDLVFPKHRLALFVHGCFWHQHNSDNCRLVKVPRSRPEYWLPKLRRNEERDRRVRRELCQLGWRVEEVWECETSDPARLRARLAKVLPRSG